MVNPVLRERKNEVQEDVLLLEEKYYLTDWYRQISVQIVIDAVEPRSYKVYIAKNCQIDDLIVAFKKYLHLENCTLYHSGKRISCETWLEEFNNGSSLLLKDKK